MRTKLIVSMGAVSLAAWMGASFVAPAEVTEAPFLDVPAEDKHSHRLGTEMIEDVKLPEKRDPSGPNLFCLLTKED